MLNHRRVLEGNLSVCVLTFYNAQVKCIKNAMKGLTDVSVMTVDSFQGSEADIILISFVRSNSKNHVGFLQDFQRLNVALTRAKRLLVLFGSGSTLENSGVSFLKELVDDVKLRRKYHDLSEIY